jgi:hypothetical protein
MRAAVSMVADENLPMESVRHLFTTTTPMERLRWLK